MLDCFLGHQAQGDEKAIELDWHIFVASHFVAIDKIGDFIFASMITDPVTMELAQLCLDRQLTKIAEIFGPVSQLFIWQRWHTGKRQNGVDRSDHVVAYKEVQRRAGGKVKQVDGDKTIVEITRSRARAARLLLPFKRDFTVLRRGECPGGEKHVLRIIEDLNVVMRAAELRGHPQPITLNYHGRVRFAILPERAIWQRETAILPGAINAGNDAVIVRVADSLGPGCFLGYRGCRCLFHTFFSHTICQAPVKSGY